MNPKNNLTNIAAALIKAQRVIEGATKTGTNPYFKSSYATLNDVMAACKTALNEQGILILQPVNTDGQNDYVETLLVHESGEYLSSRMRILPPKNMQDMGSAISYARRYSLQSLVFMSAEDNDAEGTMNRTTTKPPHAVTKKLSAVEKPASFSTAKVVNDDEF